MNNLDDWIALLTSPRGLATTASAVGAFLLALAIGGIIDNQRLDTYVKTSGEIVDTNVFREKVRVNGNWTVRDLSTIEYEYKTDRRTEIGTRVYPTESIRWGVGSPMVALGLTRRIDSRVPFHSEAEARVLVEQYPVGKKVDVYYDRDGIGSAFLVKEYSVTISFFVLGFLLLGIGGYLFFSGKAEEHD